MSTVEEVLRKMHSDFAKENPMESSKLNQLTQDKVHEYKEAFNMYDKDHDGILSVQKLGAVLRALGHNPTEIEIQEMIDEIDSEGTGFIDFESFLDVVMSRDLDEEDHEVALREAFKMFDRDGNGYIDADELRLCMMNLGEKLTLEEVEEMIKEVDVDFDGRMNYEEFVKLMCTKYPLT
ncbi:calmodulin-beta-like isoform X1 [Saccostrea cucullata]|uniref:calmodulin-beta-like n=2 Tax=Saccostrea TaxID=33508 RepID=UPI002A80F133|nr:calmodulin-beta-like [Saccostrea echinata]